MVVWIVILLLAIFAFVAAYFASRTWHWANVTLLVLVFLSTVFYLVLASEVVRIRAVYGKKIARDTKRLEELEIQNRALRAGTEDSQVINQLARNEIRVPEDGELVGIRDLDHQMNLRTRSRGRVWRSVGPAGPLDPETGLLPVVVEAPVPHGIDPNTILFVFERGDPSEGRQYLGEFRVTDAGDGGVTLQSVLDLDDGQLERLNNSQGPWAMYESMPTDEYALFEPLSDEQLGNLLPQQSSQEYIRHMDPRTPDDDQWHVAAYDETGAIKGPEDAAETENLQYRYRRVLRDYSFLFQELARERVVLLADMAAVEQDNAKLVAAIEGAKQLKQYRENEIAKLQTDVAGVKKDRQTIEKHLAQLQQQIQAAQRLLAETIQENELLAQQLAQLQQAQRALLDQQVSLPR